MPLLFQYQTSQAYKILLTNALSISILMMMHLIASNMMSIICSMTR